MNLRQKLALVRQRLGYIQKRGLNEVHSYRYVTAADIAGATTMQRPARVPVQRTRADFGRSVQAQHGT